MANSTLYIYWRTATEEEISSGAVSVHKKDPNGVDLPIHNEGKRIVERIFWGERILNEEGIEESVGNYINEQDLN